MTILILHPSPEVSRRLEQDILAAGAMVFSSGNSPDNQHYEVSNPHHHAALIYRDYNNKIFGGQKSQKLVIYAISSLVIDADVVLCLEELTGEFLVGKSVAASLGIPVVKRVEDIFTLPPDREPEEKHNYITLDGKRFFLTQDEAEAGALSDESISILEKEFVPYYNPKANYGANLPVIKQGAIIFPGGMVQ